VQEAVNAGLDTVKSYVSLVLPVNVEVLRLAGNSPIDGTGNAVRNTLIGKRARQRSFRRRRQRRHQRAARRRRVDRWRGAGWIPFRHRLRPRQHRPDRRLCTGRRYESISDHAIFVGLARGHLAPGAFFVGTAAHDGDDRIIYNPATAR